MPDESDAGDLFSKSGSAVTGAGADVGAPPPPPNQPAAAAGSDDSEPGYRETQKTYALRYGYGIRTIKLWISEGRAAGKLPPLDDPEAMLSWWAEVKSNSVPARLLAAAEVAKRGRVASGGAPANQAEGSGASTSAAPVVEPAPAPKKPLAVGFAASLQRVREAEAEAHAAYLDELTKTGEARNDGRIERLRKAWSELSEQLRFLEKAAPDVLGRSGEMLMRDDVRKILSKLHSPIVAGVRSLFRRIRAKTGNLGVPAAVLDEFERHYSAEVEKLFGELCASEFAPA